MVYQFKLLQRKACLVSLRIVIVAVQNARGPCCTTTNQIADHGGRRKTFEMSVAEPHLHVGDVCFFTRAATRV